MGRENTHLEEVQKLINPISQLIPASTVSANLLLSGYIYDVDYFFSINLMAERSASGGFLPIISDVDIFRPGLTWNRQRNLAYDIIIIGLAFLLTFLFGYNLRKGIKEKRCMKYLSKFVIVVTLFYFIVILLYIYESFKSILFDHVDHFLTSNEFFDARDTAKRFKSLLRLKAVGICLNLIMLFLFLNHKITKEHTVNILNLLILKNLKYLFVIIPCFSGFAIVGMKVLGPYNHRYSTFSGAFQATWFAACGSLGKFFLMLGIGNELKANHLSSFAFISILFYCVLFLSFAIFVAYGFLSYFQIMKKVGFYADFLHKANAKGMFLFI